MFKDPKICLGIAKLLLGLGVVSVLWLFSLLSGLVRVGSGSENWMAIAAMFCVSVSLRFDRRAQTLAKAAAVS